MHRRAGKLGRAAESAEARIECAPEHGKPAIEDARIDAPAARAPFYSRRLLQLLHHVARRFVDLFAIAPPRRRNLRQHRREPRTPPAIFRREIRAAKERLQLRCEPYRHGPSAATRRSLDECHINTVDIRPLLAIYLDRDVIAIQQFGDLIVLERFALHHVAPMASRVTDGQKDRFVLRARPFERFRPPREPIHGIVRMLEKVGALFVSETIHK